MRLCDKCGTRLGSYGPDGLCPRCLLLDGIGDDASWQFGDYVLLQEVARGGMGVVWKARQVPLNRTVAVKMMLSGTFASPESLRRFRSEAEAAASLQHPNIVAIHEIGEQDGQPFFSMDYVDGQNLAQLVRDRPLPFRQGAACLKTIAEAVHYAHEHQILHRDLKPSNILIDEAGQPHVTDFGLAKRLTADADITHSGQVLGSPNYLPPEQAEGRQGDVGPASDIYSLGAILYCLLTGRAPFQAETVADTLKLVSTADPVPPRLLNPSVPKDLETICLKCLEKEIPRRYATARELADELGRFLGNEPIRARPLGPLGKTARWRRRNPGVAAALLALLLVFLIGFAGVTWEWQRAQTEMRRAERNEATAVQSERRLAENLYAADISLAHQSLNENNLGQARRLLDQHRPRPGQPDLRGWEWRHLWQASQSDAEAEFQLPPGSTGLEVSPQGRWLLVGRADTVIELWDLRLFKPVRQMRAPVTDRGVLHTAAAFSPSGDVLAVTTEDRKVELWQLDPLEKAGELLPSNRVNHLLFSPNGRQLAVREFTRGSTNSDAGKFDYVGLWAVTPLQRLWRTPIPSGDNLNRGLAFRPDGTTLVVGMQIGQLAPLNTTNGRLDSLDRLIGTQGPVITAAAYSPDGKIIASAAGYEGDAIRLWDATSGAPRGELTGCGGYVSRLHFSSDGLRLYSAASDQRVRVWDVAQRRQQLQLRGHQDAVISLTPIDQGQKLWSASRDGKILLWNLARGTERKSPQLLDGFGSQPQFSPDCRFVGSVVDRKVVIRDAMTLAALTNLAPPHTNVAMLAGFGSDKLTLVTYEGPLQVWSLQEKRVVAEGPSFDRRRGPLEVDPAGRHLVQLDFEKMTVHAWDLETGRTNTHSAPLERDKSPVGYQGPFVVAPDLRTLVMFQENGTMHWWSLPDGKLLASITAYATGVFNTMRFSPDGRLVATSGFDGIWKLWDASTRRLIRSERGFLNGIFSVAFSPDSRRLATASSGADSVKLWDMATGRELLRLNAWRELVFDVGFSPDGATLYARNRFDAVALYRTPSLAAIDQTDAAIPPDLPKP